MSYDAKSYELADYFLNDYKVATEMDKIMLAQRIQNAIEDFINYDLDGELKEESITKA